MYKLNESTIDAIEKSSKNRISVCKHVGGRGVWREEALDCAKPLIQNEFFFHSFRSFVRSLVKRFLFCVFPWIPDCLFRFWFNSNFLGFQRGSQIENRIEKSRRIQILSAAFWHRAHSNCPSKKHIIRQKKTQPYRIISWHDMRWLGISKGHAFVARIYECFSLANV